MARELTDKEKEYVNELTFSIVGGMLVPTIWYALYFAHAHGWKCWDDKGEPTGYCWMVGVWTGLSLIYVCCVAADVIQSMVTRVITRHRNSSPNSDDTTDDTTVNPWAKGIVISVVFAAIYVIGWVQGHGLF